MMRQLLMMLAAVPLLLLAAPQAGSAAETWQLDASHSSTGFKVRHMMVSWVRGSFTAAEGTITLDPNDPSKTAVDISIDASSIDTGNKKRDDHLRNGDFLDTTSHPKITYKSKSVRSAKDGKFELVGDLSIRGVTKEVVLMVEGPSDQITGPWGNHRRGFSAHTTINRNDFGVSWNKALDAGGVVIGEEVKIEIEAEIMKKAE